MLTEAEYTDKTDAVIAILERQYTRIDESLAAITAHESRAEAVCGPVSQARFAIAQARINISSAENILHFFSEIAHSTENTIYANVAQAALAEVAKRRSQSESGETLQ